MSASMHRYRSHTCGALRESDVGQVARLSGWCHRIRDHGGVLFIDLRDHYGMTQCVIDPDSPAFKQAEAARSEWVIRVDGKVRKRPAGTENPELPTGTVEVYITDIEVLGPAAELPMPVFGDQDYPEEIRLKYRFLDLRREQVHANIMLRSAVIASLRTALRVTLSHCSHSSGSRGSWSARSKKPPHSEQRLCCVINGRRLTPSSGGFVRSRRRVQYSARVGSSGDVEPGTIWCRTILVQANLWR